MLLISSVSKDNMWFEGKLERHTLQCIIPEKLNRKTEIIFPAESWG
jgi:hypothetical protein